MIERILIPLDGSETAEAILPQVKRVLKRHDAEVILLRIASVYAIADIETPMAVVDLMDEAKSYVEKTARKLEADGVRARGLVGEGPVAATILDVAAKERASLIAMSTHGRTGLSRFVFGSVAEKVVRASDIPVLLVRSFEPAGEGWTSTVATGERPFHNILIPVDGSDPSLQVLPIVKEFARPLDARATVTNVLEERNDGSRWASAKASITDAVEELNKAAIPASFLIRKGDPATEILNVCRDQSMDLIAMSTHGRSGPSRWVFGSVTEKVLRASTAPMLIVRSRKEK
jgi:nucleotide-binding universal stress UspA family protein